MQISKKIQFFLRKRWLSLRELPLKYTAPYIVNREWQDAEQPSPGATSHKLPSSLIVNLTSYPPRYPTLELTLKSLLLQSVRPDKLVLWLYQHDIPRLPATILDLQKYGLTIQSVESDIKSYKKLVPALQTWPEAFHVTADDDIYYRHDWLASLTGHYRGKTDEVLCLRAHYIRLNAHGYPLPYRSWESKTYQTGPDQRLFPTTGSGALFPPGSLHPDATRSDLFLKLSPNADDIWFYWMALLQGSSIRRVGSNKKLITWRDSKGISLWSSNKQSVGGNDEQIANMITTFGFPVKIVTHQ